MCRFTIFSLVAVLFFNVGYALKKRNQINDYNIIPQPLKLVAEEGNFVLSKSTKIYFHEHARKFVRLRNQFIGELNQASGIKIVPTDKRPLKGICIYNDDKLTIEGYRLLVKKTGIEIYASASAGAYYALQSIKQLIVNEVYKDTKPDTCIIQAVSIYDMPKFSWRGFMLDESRHFFGKEKVKKILDFMAELKLNRFHWHLTDDQGWRIQIKKYPKLTEIGAWRVDYNNRDESLNNWWGRPLQKKGEKATYGGFYTQEDIKEIVGYAKERHIEILPEIDVPGHSLSILASYPELSCNPSKAYYVGTGGVLKDNALCASNPKTYQFLENVLGEVMELFPLDYIHIGGDECNKSGWINHEQCQHFIKDKDLKNEGELQSYIIKEVEKMVNAKGKNIIGWDEILEGGLAPNATVMSWRGEEGGIVAAKAGHQVIMTPMKYNYLDLRQGQAASEPNLGYSEALLSTCYNYKVIPNGLTKTEAKNILGLQGNLWTESISDWSKLTYMTFPRLFAVAENGWTAESNQSFEDFIERLQPWLKRLDTKDIRYAKSAFNPWIYQIGNGTSIEIVLGSELNSPEIRYTLDGTDPTKYSRLYSSPFKLKQSKTIKAAIFKNEERMGNIVESTFTVHKAAGAKVVYKHPFSKGDIAAKKRTLTDLNYGQLEVEDDKNWQGFYDDFDVIVELNSPTDLQEVIINTLRLTIFGIYPPTNIEVFGSTDGQNFTRIGGKNLKDEALIQGRNIINNKIKVDATGIVKIRVRARLLEQIPKGHHKAGEKPCLKIDEIIVL